MNNRRRLLVAFGTSVLAVMVLMSYLLWSGYQDALLTAATTSRNYAAIIEARLDATLRRADTHVLELARELPVAALNKQAVPRYARELDARLDLRLLNFPELLGLRVFDVDGDLIYASGGKTTPRINVVDRDYFRLLRDGPHNDPVFSEVVTGRSVGRQIVLVARALRDGQAAFRGIVTASIDLEYFQTLFQSLDLGAHGVVAIYRSDNFTLVTRWPRGDNKLNTPLSKGSPIHMAMTSGKRTMTFATSSNVDGMVRVYSNHVLERYPFFASTGIAREDVLAGWRDRTLGVVLSGLVLLGLLASSLYRLERAEARQAQAMTNLAESEHRHRDLVATIPGAVYEFRVDSTGRRSMPFVSKGIVELTGLSPEEIQADVEVTFRQVPAAAMPVMEQSIRDSLENLTPWLHEFPLQTTTGEDKWLRGHSIPRRDADGSTRWHGVFIDITARVAAEKALQESQARLASIIDSARDAIITVDETGRILVFNRAAETMFRCNAAGAVGQSLERFIPQRFHAAHRDYVRKFGATGASARAMGQAGDVSGLSADGEEFPVEAAISHVTVGGRQLFTVMLRDIVGRIAAAEKQRDVLVKEVHHRIKNNLQGVIGLMQQHAAAHSELKDLVERMVAQIRAIAVIHGMHSERTQGEIGLCELVTEISRATTVLTQIEIAADGPDDTSGAIRIPKDEAVPLALVLNELLFNAIKHGLKETGGGGGVRVSVSGHDGLARVRISNPGVLPAPDFDFAKGAGLGTGLNLVKSLLSRHGARLEIVQEGDQVVADLTLTDPAIICSS